VVTRDVARRAARRLAPAEAAPAPPLADARRPPLRALIVMPVATARGGAEQQLCQLVEQRAAAGVAPAVAFLQGGPMVDWCRAQGVPAFVVEAGRVRQPQRLARAVRALARLAREQQAELVVGWMAKGQLYGGLAAAVARLPSAWLQPGTPAGAVPIDRAATALPARVVVTVSHTVDRAQRRLLPRRPTTVVHPAVDTERFDPQRIGDPRAVRRRLGLPEDGLIVGAVGRLDRWKGFHVLLDVAPALLKRYPDATLVLVGGPHELDPSYARELHAQAAQLDPSGGCVRLIGQQPNPEEWMQAMDVFVHTSHEEPFGMVVIEAMALGKPVLAAAEGGPAEIVTPGVDGLLSPHGDRDALTAALLRLLADEPLRAQLGEAAARRARDFEVGQFARSFGAVLADAARNSPGRVTSQ
jgi:hypothetical protein